MTSFVSRSFALLPILVSALALTALPLKTWATEGAGNPAAKLRVDETPLASSVREATSLAPIVRQAAPSVVSIATTKYVESSALLHPWRRFFQRPDATEPDSARQPVSGIGSGVIVTEDGYILTNSHVVDDVDEIKVVLSDGKTEYDGRVIGRDPLTDLAVLKVDASDLPAIAIGNSDQLEVGDLVLAVGNPFGVGQTVTSGIVSATGRSGFFLLYEDYIQTDASINPGNSGGALVDAQGRLVGINTFIASTSGASAGVGFTIPINLARDVMDKLVRFGEVRRGFLGVELERSVSPDLAREFDLPDTRGALITRVLPDGPAAQAGVKPGDFIVEFNGHRVEDRRSLQFHVGKADPGSEATLKLIRNGKPRTLKLTLSELDPQQAAADNRPAPPPARVLEGVELVDLDDSNRREFQIPPDTDGRVLVTNVDPESAAYTAGLRPGMIILEAGRQPVESVRDLRRTAAQGGDNNRLLLRVRNTNGSVSYLVVRVR